MKEKINFYFLQSEFVTLTQNNYFLFFQIKIVLKFVVLRFNFFIMYI